MTEQGSNGRLLVVCRANVCRSPLAEFVAVSRFADSGVTIASAGTDAEVGYGVCAQVERLLARRPGGNDFLAGHRVTPLRASRVGTADLILAMSPRERSRVALTYPWLRDRTFTVIEAQRLLSELPVAGRHGTTLWDLARLMHEQRWIAAEENWPHRTRDLLGLVQRRRPARGLAIADAHASRRRPSHARLLPAVETLVGQVSDEILVRLGRGSGGAGPVVQVDSNPAGDSRHVI